MKPGLCSITIKDRIMMKLVNNNSDYVPHVSEDNDAIINTEEEY